jgi:hypothetical protein
VEKRVPTSPQVQERRCAEKRLLMLDMTAVHRLLHAGSVLLAALADAAELALVRR